jgi:hypothetical protein
MKDDNLELQKLASKRRNKVNGGHAENKYHLDEDGTTRPLSKFLEDRTRQCLRNPTMAHINTNGILVHPSITRLWIIIQVQGVFFPRAWRPVVTAVCP